MSERTLQEFRGMEGPYGVLKVVANGTTFVDFQLTSEFVRLTRMDAQELVRVLAQWLMVPRDAQVVRTHGEESEVHIVDRGPGRPSVTLTDDDGPRPRQSDQHYAVNADGRPRVTMSDDDGPRPRQSDQHYAVNGEGEPRRPT